MCKHMRMKNGSLSLLGAVLIALTLGHEALTAFAETTAPETTIAFESNETTTMSGTETTSAPTETTTTMITTPDPLTKLTYSENESGVTLERFAWTNELVVEIPAQVDGKPITKIGERAFQYCYADTVILPETVTELAAYAFVGCRYLTTITIPQNCRRIGASAFSGCIALETVVIPEQIDDIGAYAFADTPFLSHMTDDFIVLGGVLYAYQGNQSTVTVPETVHTIGVAAFADHTEILSIAIPEHVTRIEHEAFENCTALSDISLLGLPSEFPLDALAGTAWLSAQTSDFLALGNLLLGYRGEETVVEIPAGIQAIGVAAFAEQPAITTLTLPDSVEEIRSEAFRDCTSLQVVTLGDGLKTIGDAAFRGCRTLHYFRVRHQLVQIGADAFTDCDALTELHLPDSVADLGDHALGWMQDADSGSYTKNDALTLFANAETVRAYAAVAGISCEPLPEDENTEPAPEVTTLSHAAPADLLHDPTYRGGLLAAGLSGMLVLVAGIAVLCRRKH